MSILETIQSGKESKPPRLMIYGQEGIGKSTFAAAAPNPIFIQTEDGLGEINCKKFPLAKTYDEVLAELTALRDEPHDFQTVVIDSADWLEKLICEDICREYCVKTIDRVPGKFGTGNNYVAARWGEVLDLLQELRDKRGIMPILVAHAKVETFRDPENTSYDRYTPRLLANAAALIVEWCDGVFFASKKLRVTKETSGFNTERGIASAIGAEGGERYIKTIGGPACTAKNRFGLPGELPLSWQAFLDAYRNGVQE
jgi:hypothetical protein